MVNLIVKNYYLELKKINCKCNNNLSSFSINEDFNINNNSFKNDSIMSTNIAVITCFKNLKSLDIKNNIGFLPITSFITVKIILFIYLKLFIKKNLNNKCIGIFQKANPPKKLVIKDKYKDDTKIPKEKYPSNSSTSRLKSRSTTRLKNITNLEAPKYEDIKIENINIISFRYAIKMDKRNFSQNYFLS